MTVDVMERAFNASGSARMEIESIARVAATLDTIRPTCLDVGLSNPVGSQRLRRLPGFWSSAVAPSKLAQARELLGAEALAMGVDGELPFEEKQFDLVVLSHHALSGSLANDILLVRECHRVLKASGCIIMTSAYRKKIDLAGKIRKKSAGEKAYTEGQIFELLKSGFDVLGLRTFGRFWVVLADSLLVSGRAGVGAGLVLWLAQRMDALLFFTKGHYLVAHGRRKGWRERQKLRMGYGIKIEESLLRRFR